MSLKKSTASRPNRSSDPDAISIATWMKELEALTTGVNVDGLSVFDAAQQMSCSASVIRARLRRLISAGKWEVKGSRLMSAIDGSQRRVPVYGPKSK